jgi:hypothetical protein
MATKKAQKVLEPKVQSVEDDEGYFDTTNDCDHLLLFVDKTFREAQGGLLCDAFMPAGSMQPRRSAIETSLESCSMRSMRCQMRS